MLLKVIQNSQNRYRLSVHYGLNTSNNTSRARTSQTKVLGNSWQQQLLFVFRTVPTNKKSIWPIWLGVEQGWATYILNDVAVILGITADIHRNNDRERYFFKCSIITLLTIQPLHKAKTGSSVHKPQSLKVGITTESMLRRSNTVWRKAASKKLAG